MDGDEEYQRHHDDLQVNLDVLWQVGSLHSLPQAAQSEQLEQTQSIEQVLPESGLVVGAGERGERYTRDEVDEEGALEVSSTDYVWVPHLDTLLCVKERRPELDDDIDEEDQVDAGIYE